MERCYATSKLNPNCCRQTVTSTDSRDIQRHTADLVYAVKGKPSQKGKEGKKETESHFNKKRSMSLKTLIESLLIPYIREKKHKKNKKTLSYVYIKRLENNHNQSSQLL